MLRRGLGKEAPFHSKCAWQPASLPTLTARLAIHASARFKLLPQNIAAGRAGKHWHLRWPCPQALQPTIPHPTFIRHAEPLPLAPQSFAISTEVRYSWIVGWIEFFWRGMVVTVLFIVPLVVESWWHCRRMGCPECSCSEWGRIPCSRIARCPGFGFEQVPFSSIENDF